MESLQDKAKALADRIRAKAGGNVEAEFASRSPALSVLNPTEILEIYDTLVQIYIGAIVTMDELSPAWVKMLEVLETELQHRKRIDAYTKRRFDSAYSVVFPAEGH